MTHRRLNPTSLFATHPSLRGLCFTQDGVWVDGATQLSILPLQELVHAFSLVIESAYCIDDQIAVYCTSQTTPALHTTPFHIETIKPFLSAIDSALQQTILTAYHWIQWDKQSRYCGQCGHLLVPVGDTTEKRCDRCKQSFFPRFSPAVIVAIRRNQHILLARSPHFKEGMYSALAGFVDLGESAEMTIHREIQEEIGIQVANVQYVGSQTWPFPDSFMLAFRADYLNGEIQIDHHEIEDAQWFDRKSLPLLPGRASIARRLIDKTLSEMTS